MLDPITELMSNRPLDWIRRQTTADDLLDDGVENFSDLRSTDAAPVESDAPPNPVHLQVRDQTLARDRAERAQLERTASKPALSVFGLVLGAIIALAGLALALHPVDMRVHHARARYLRSVVEHVTPATSRFYGISLVVCGLAIAFYSAQRPRKQ